MCAWMRQEDSSFSLASNITLCASCSNASRSLSMYTSKSCGSSYRLDATSSASRPHKSDSNDPTRLMSSASIGTPSKNCHGFVNAPL